MPDLELMIYDSGAVAIKAGGEDWAVCAHLGKRTGERREVDRTIYTFQPTDRELGDILQAIRMARGDDLHWSIEPEAEAEELPMPNTDDLSIAAAHELVWRALSKRPGWVYSGPLEAARTRKLTTYLTANHLAELERRGLVSLTLSKSKERYTVRLTEAGRAAVLAMPEDFFAEAIKKNPWQWNEQDIRKAKARLSEADE